MDDPTEDITSTFEVELDEQEIIASVIVGELALRLGEVAAEIWRVGNPPWRHQS